MANGCSRVVPVSFCGINRARSFPKAVEFAGNMSARADRVKHVSTYSALASYAGIILVVWAEARSHPAVIAGLGSHFFYALASFAWLLAPLWFFGFGLGEWLRDSIHSRMLRALLPALLGVAYLVFAIPAGDVRGAVVALLFGLPVILAALLEFAHLQPKLKWQDAVVLTILVAIYLMRWLTAAWPYPGLAILPKLFVADLVLYLFLVVRRLDGIGYSFFPGVNAVSIGLREWIYFLPFGIGLGFSLGFIHFNPRLPSALSVVGSILITLILVALPEEMLFRGILQNLLETRFGKGTALFGASLLFGLAHFNKGAIFNWRYVLLASIAGVFYGRAWRAHRQLLASVITHTAVDVVWSLWFR